MPKKFNKEIQYIDIFDLLPNEVFLDITEDIVPGIYDYYRVSNYGRVFHKYLGRFMKPGINGGGYLYIIVSTAFGPVPVQIHRIEMILFNPIPNYNLFDVNHKDGNKLNDFLGNLEWMTRKENIQHAYDTGLHHKGQDSPKTNLTNDIVIHICELLQENKYTNKQVALMVGNGVTENIVSSIKQRESWKNISSSYQFIQRVGKAFNEDLVRNICLYFQCNPKGNLTVTDHSRNALSSCGFSTEEKYVDSVRKIYNRKYYTNISQQYNF